MSIFDLEVYYKEDVNMAVKLDIKKNSYGEFVVRWIEDGRRIEAKCYYTDDKQDAVDTKKEMQKEIDRNKEVK